MDNSVESNAAAHRELLQSIQAVDYAPPTLAQVKRQLDTTLKEVKDEKATLARYEASTKKEYKDWQDIKDRVSKRLWVKIKHPASNKEILNSMTEKEEQEYIQAFEREQGCRNRLEALEGQIQDLSKQIDSLKPYAEEHRRLRRQLEDLYKRVFDGPTPRYPQEDAAEEAYKNALRHYDASQTTLANENRAVALLKQAAACMNIAAQNVASAESASTWDMMGGGAMMDMMERSALARAQRAADQARLFVQQAQTLSPNVPGLAAVRMPQGNLMSDMVFDNFFTDYMFHQKIQRAAADLRIVRSDMLNVISQAQTFVANMAQQCNAAGRELERTREKLEQTRKEIMIRASEVPPAYPAA